MAYDYDELYRTTPNALGAPTKAISDFVEKLDTGPMRILDVGCGQGRDALFMARLGHSVVGVDLSQSGVDELNKTAQAEGLKIKAIAEDLAHFSPPDMFDLILFDRTLHMLDVQLRFDVVARFLEHLNVPGWVMVADEKSNMPKIKSQILDQRTGWTIAVEKGGYFFAQS